jgi:hypothetical protein
MNRPIVITGCQRSGTTLLHLILDSHPHIHSVDEADFDDRSRDSYLHGPEFGPVVSFKLPRVAWNVDFIRRLPGARTIWCIRDPRAVVSSMLRLQLDLDDGEPIAWAAHPHGAEYELHFVLRSMSRAARLSHLRLARQFQRIRRTPPRERDREQQVFLAALCWRLKNQLFLRHGTAVKMHLVRYEQLVREPDSTLRQVLDIIGVEWNDRVLQHHRLHRGVSIGGTDNTRSIDTASTGKWAYELSAGELDVIATLCSGTARSYDYSLAGD